VGVEVGLHLDKSCDHEGKEMGGDIKAIEKSSELAFYQK